MTANSPNDRLSQISTLWTALFQGVDVQSNECRRKAMEFLEHYQRAVYGYLLRAVHDPDLALELFQEFALRYLKGDFRNVDPDRGRFRDYLRTVLINLIRRSHRKTLNVAHLDVEPVVHAEEPNEDEFLAHWRQAILEIAWQTLETEQKKGGAPYYSVLRLRTDHPDENSAELAKRLSTTLGSQETYTEAGLRKLLQRSREVFSDRVVEEVARSISSQDRERVTQELIDLGFYGFCRKALERWNTQ